MLTCIRCVLVSFLCLGKENLSKWSWCYEETEGMRESCYEAQIWGSNCLACYWKTFNSWFYRLSYYRYNMLNFFVFIFKKYYFFNCLCFVNGFTIYKILKKHVYHCLGLGRHFLRKISREYDEMHDIMSSNMKLLTITIYLELYYYSVTLFSSDVVLLPITNSLHINLWGLVKNRINPGLYKNLECVLVSRRFKWWILALTWYTT